LQHIAKLSLCYEMVVILIVIDILIVITNTNIKENKAFSKKRVDNFEKIC